MASWRLAKSLEKLREQINAAAPARSKLSDGSIGDPAHATRASDHNPNLAGVVTAIDVTHDPQQGVDGNMLFRWVTTDPRTKYAIFNGQIWKARTGKREVYAGANSHSHHVHVSVKPESADDVSLWPGIGKGQPKPTLKAGDQGTEVELLQRKLGIEVDGQFGPLTLEAVKKFQEENGLTVDGIVGSEVWERVKQ